MHNRALVFLATLALLGAGGSLAAESNSDFLSNAIEGDNSEIALGALALARGSTGQIRDFGLTLFNDHRKAKAGAVALAKKQGVTVPTQMTDEAKAELQKLQGLDGSAFDDEFASYMVKDHTKDVADFTDQSKAKDDVGRYAKKTLPTLEKHLRMAKSFAAKHGAPAASSSSAPASPAPTSTSSPASSAPSAQASSSMQ